MRPRGLGLRLKSLQLQPRGVAGAGGARWPFTSVVAVVVGVVVLPLATIGSDGLTTSGRLVDEELDFRRDEVRRRIRAVSMGERLLVRDLRVCGASSSSSVISSRGRGVAARLAAERVTGGK